ncbi:DUF6457 domain-containing protein [uncultured Kocuria sp.]|uniref:DUF6457 domain-containing protein n=1 Tax=uncultured Kocuria sp. TaxID=259305 RepID=UPI00262C4872|nr:DUF6457 domain-containing protein [uncultured Kocuria sp.]
MPEDLSPSENEILERWIATVRGALDVPDADLPVDEVLGLTGRIAHGTVRPAVPPTAYLLGYHVARAVAAGEDEHRALARALQTVDGLVPDARRTPEEN